jgi:hypothetical protein
MVAPRAANAPSSIRRRFDFTGPLALKLDEQRQQRGDGLL